MHNAIMETHHLPTAVQNLTENDFLISLPYPIPRRQQLQQCSIIQWQISQWHFSFQLWWHQLVRKHFATEVDEQRKRMCLHPKNVLFRRGPCRHELSHKMLMMKTTPPRSGDMPKNHHVASFFCTNDVLRLPPSAVDIGELREPTDRISQHVNKNGGWWISGSLESSVNDESITQEVQRVSLWFGLSSSGSWELEKKT